MSFFLQRLVPSDLFFDDEVCIAVLSLIYVDRLSKTSPRGDLVSRMTIHRILAAAVLVSIKFLIDELPQHFMTVYSKCAGVTKREIVFLETELLRLLDWKISVCTNEWEEYVRAFVPAAPDLQVDCVDD